MSTDEFAPERALYDPTAEDAPAERPRRRPPASLDGRTVAHVAHLAGATQGVACGLMFGTNVAVRTCERILRTLAAVASVAAVLAPVALLQSHAHQLR